MGVFNKSIYYYTKINKTNKIFLFFTFIFIFKFSLCDYCPRDKPILKDNICMSTYCPYADLEDNVCEISNPFIKSQWLNNIHIFALEPISGISVTSNSKGDLFLMSQGFSNENSNLKYLFAFYQDGTGLFYDKLLNYHYSFEKIDFPEDKNPDVFHSVFIDEKEYLLSTQNKDEMFLIDFHNKNYSILTLNSTTYFSEDIFRLKGYFDDESIEDEDERVYFTDYIHFGSDGNCFLGLKIFRFNLTNIVIEKEINDEIQISPFSNIYCFQNEYLYIQCIYTTFIEEENEYNLMASLFDYKTLEEEYAELLQDDLKRQSSFDNSIQLKGNIFVTGISDPNNTNVIKLFLKKFIRESSSTGDEIFLENYLPNIEYININEDNQYIIDRGLSNRNSMVKMSETKFAILLNEFSDTKMDSSWNKKLLILICNIFDDSRISIRYYKINFELYDLLIYEDIRGYNLNNFFGVLVETVVNTDIFNPKAIFLTFGYVNSTYDEEIDKNLKQNDTNSVIILQNYITSIENNLFGYKLIGVQILKLPDINLSGYFINNATNEKIKVGDIVSIDTVLRFILSRKLNVESDFTIDFAGVVQEPDYDDMNLNSERVDIYPVNNSDSERNFYIPQKLIGKVVHYTFEIRCFDSCNGCTKLSNNIKEQYCLQCKRGYYFEKGTNNCIQEIECYPNCETCSATSTNSQSMNCLSCKEGFHFFEETNNCLNCPKYVNYNFTSCIEEIPEGYYLQNEELGLLGKCHELCKTCDDGPELWGYNCIECKYKSEIFKPRYDGDCPTEYFDEMEEEEPMMPGGECRRDEPILIRNDFCSMVYCSPKEYEDKICVLSNSIIKAQWMNNIQRFGDGNIIFISVSYGIDGELYLFGQKRDVSNNNLENYIYGVDINGLPIFFNNDEYYYFKNVKFPKGIYLEGVRYVKNFENNKTFLLSTQIENEMYGIELKNETTEIFKFEKSSYSSDNIFIFKNH